MYDDNYVVNQCLANPGLAISAGGSTLVKYANTFTFKANGRISPSITTANAPALTSAALVAPFPNGVAAAPGALATGFARVYTLIATLPINGTATVTPTFSWLCSSDFPGTTDVTSSGAVVDPNQSNQCMVGTLYLLNQTGSNFTPGTTALDVANLTAVYENNYAYIGA